MKENAQLNDTSAAILGIMHEGQMHGGEVVELADRWMPYFSITRSQVYRELKAMAEKGLVKELVRGARLKQPYRITAQGKRAFKTWMLSEPDLDPIRNTMALRQAFAEHIGGDALVDMKEKYIALHRAALDKIEAQLKEADNEDLWNDQVALKFAAGYHQVALDWLS